MKLVTVKNEQGQEVLACSWDEAASFLGCSEDDMVKYTSAHLIATVYPAHLRGRGYFYPIYDDLVEVARLQKRFSRKPLELILEDRFHRQVKVEQFCKHCGLLLEPGCHVYCDECVGYCPDCNVMTALGRLCDECVASNPAYARLAFGHVDLDQYRSPGELRILEGRYEKVEPARSVFSSFLRIFGL